MSDENIGSPFQNFLDENNIKDDVNNQAIKNVNRMKFLDFLIKILI